MMLITTQSHLDALCLRLSQEQFLTVDTEFLREKTYYPKLCLIQIAGTNEAAAIDPLVEGLDLSPLWALFDNPAICKVFHAARQDLEIFSLLAGRLPTYLADTQIMAMVCGYGDSVSYETLVNKICKAQLDKSSRFTDWSRRPLSDKQLRYALDDVIYLRQIYEKLKAEISQKNRHNWLLDEQSTLTNPDTYRVDPETVWLKLKARTDKPRHRALLQKLAAWREREAQRIDVPKGRILRDEALLEIVYHPPTHAADLARIRGLTQGFADSRQGLAILAVVAEAMALPESACPPAPARGPDLPGGTGAVVDLLRVLLRHICDEAGVATRLVANSDELELLAATDNADIRALKGWRLELFGEAALALKAGQLRIGLKGRNLCIETERKG